MTRKRAPSGGRKPIGPSAARAQFSVRMPDDLRTQLEAEAQKCGRTLTQEMLGRLRASLREDRRDPAMRALCYIFSDIAERVGSRHFDLLRQHRQKRYGDRIGPWTRDPFVFKAFRLGVEKVLAALEPHGEMQNPYAFLAEGSPSTPEFIKKTPEEAADFAAQVVLHLLMFGNPLTPEQMVELRKKEPYGEHWANDLALDVYDMSNARNGLGLELPTKTGD
jgi:Arc-like DNA binding domain